MPHAVAIDDGAAGGLGDRQHAAVDMIGNAGDHPRRRAAKALRPILAHQLMIGADAAGRNDDGLRLERERADDLARTFAPALNVARRENIAAHAIDDRAGFGQRIDPVPELEGDQPLRRAFAHAFDERLDDARSGSPGQMKARHRIAVAGGVAAAAFSPADHRKEAQAPLPQPRSFLAGGEGDVSLRPLPRPEILFAIERGRAHPVLERQRVRVANAQASLLGRVDQENAAERPESLAAQRLLGLLIEHDDLLARVDQLGRGDEAGEPRSQR